MVMDGRHQENALSGQLERNHLRNDARHLKEENPAQDDGEELIFREKEAPKAQATAHPRQAG